VREGGGGRGEEEEKEEEEREGGGPLETTGAFCVQENVFSTMFISKGEKRKKWWEGERRRGRK
jgi:hypothetical protein